MYSAETPFRPGSAPGSEGGLRTSVCVLAAGGLAVVLHAGDGGLAEEAVLVVHQVLVDAGSAHKHTQRQGSCDHPQNIT